jgi:hypothetical protein
VAGAVPQSTIFALTISSRMHLIAVRAFLRAGFGRRSRATIARASFRFPSQA